MIEESILNVLALRLLSSCDSSMRSLLLKTTPSFSLHPDTGRLRLTLAPRLEKVAIRLAKSSQALLNRLRRLAGNNCEVIVVHNIAPTGEPSYLVKLDSIKERDGYYTGPFILVGSSQIRLPHSDSG